MSKGKWILDIQQYDNEIWMPEEYFDDKEDAQKYGYEIAEKEGLSRFRIGLCEDAENFGIDVDRVIENIQEAMYEEIGEAAEDYLDDVTKEDALELEKRLNEVFYKWQEEHNYKPSFYKIISEEVIEVEK
ncbi:hypothetical protein [Clostridium butyricum]